MPDNSLTILKSKWEVS